MSIDRLIEKCRDQYQSHLRKAVEVERLKHPELVTELAMKLNGESWDERLLLTRIDMVWGDQQNPTLTNAELEPIKLTPDQDTTSVIERVLIRATEFRWHSCAIRLHPAPTTWSPIWEWFDSWFDLQGQHGPDREGFENVIHGFSQAEPDVDGGCMLTVDFGSAPSVCVEDFIRRCRPAGVRKLALS